MDSTTPRKQRIHYEDVSIGWICALPVELTAARSMLDNEYEPFGGQRDGHPNSYVFGLIGRHKIVIACLDNAGDPSSATRTAVQLLCSFPTIKYCLVVGIAGGVPCSDKDIRLGDVLLQHPQGNCGGIFAPEVGKSTQGATEHRGHFNGPPGAVLSAINDLESKRGLKSYPDRLMKIIEEANDKLKEPAWPPPADDLDVLYCSKAASDSNHDSTSCRLRCDPLTNRAQRCPRLDRTPRVFRGVFASSHKVIADGIQRDNIIEDIYNKQGLKIFAFEMEAFGVANVVPCQVIRGVSDYADSTKNDKWQRSASLAAAAYAKELLESLPPATTRQGRGLLEQRNVFKQEKCVCRTVMTGSRDHRAKFDHGMTGRSNNGADAHNDVHPALGHSEKADMTERALPTSYLSNDIEPDAGNTPEERVGMLDRLRDINQRLSSDNPDLSTATHVAATWGDLDIIDYLKNRGQDLGIKDKHGQTPIHLAVWYGQVSMVDYLRQLGQGIGTKDNYGQTPIHLAAGNGQITMVNYLQQRGQSIKVKDYSGRTLIHLAALNGQEAMFGHLRKLGQDIGIKDDNGWMPMHFAAVGGQIAMVDYLRQLGQDIGIKDDNGWMPMHFAAAGGQIAMVDYLRQLGQDIGIKDNRGWTPEDIAAATRQVAMVDHLRQVGQDIGRV